MFDITTTIEVRYGQDNDQVVYAYQDHTDKQTWYMVPIPRIRTVNGNPVFSVNKYTKNGGGVSGSCTFQAELVQPEEAKAAVIAAVEKKGGSVTSWGGFVWVGGVAYFHYQIEGVYEYLAVEPTLYGTNVATFHVELPTPEALNEFANSLSGGDGGVSPFSIEYNMQVLTELLGAEATVEYDSETAISYQETYRTESDTWGRQKRVLEEVKQVLQQSGAGEVTVKMGAGGTQELEQRVRDWAWTTLETQVSDTVAAAATMASTNSSPVTATTSFKTTYTEDAVVDWSTPVVVGIPVFTPQQWDKVYRDIDNRNLEVQFALIGQMTNTEDGLGIANRVTITVDYPTKQTDTTFELLPGNGDKSSRLYTAEGYFPDGEYDPNFRYKYVISFSSGSDYDSGWIDSSQTVVNITPRDFGSRQVTFIGQNVPFGDASGDVDKVEIEFFFAPPEGNEALVQVATLNANGNEDGAAVMFNSYYNLPIGAVYNYRLRYMLNNGSIISSGLPLSISSAPENTTSGNADIVFVTDPALFSTNFNLRARNNSSAKSILMVDFGAQYFDKENGGDSALFHQDWNGWMPDPDRPIETAEPTWTFGTVDNTNTAYYKLEGSIFFTDNSEQQLGNNFYQPSSQGNFMIYADAEAYSIEIKTFAVDWDVVESVSLTMFQFKPIDGATDTTPPAFLHKNRADMTVDELAEAERSQYNLLPFSLLKAPQGQPQDVFNRFYTLQRPLDQPKVEFYYTVEYIMRENGESRFMRDQQVSGDLFVSLPPLPPAGGEPGFVKMSLDPVALAGRPDCMAAE